MSAHVLTINTDGGSRGNPGQAAFGYVVSSDGRTVAEEGGRLGIMTNNQAEYTALVRALGHAKRLGTGYRVVIVSDSELMVKQMRGEYKVKNAELRDLFEEARDLAAEFANGVEFRHVRREFNKRADELCNEALDGRREPSLAGDEATPPPTPRATPTPSLHDEAVACLRRAGAGPSPEAVWADLQAILRRHGSPAAT